jgi:hypothetical protein
VFEVKKRVAYLEIKSHTANRYIYIGIAKKKTMPEYPHKSFNKQKWTE